MEGFVVRMRSFVAIAPQDDRWGNVILSASEESLEILRRSAPQDDKKRNVILSEAKNLLRSFVAPLLRMTRKKVQDDRRMGRHSERSEESHQRSTVILTPKRRGKNPIKGAPSF